MKKTYQKYIEALKGSAAPCLILDLDYLDHNIDWSLGSSGDKKIRLATKSLRSLEVINYIQKKSSQFQGLMTFTLPEALWLKKKGHKDLLMGYPTMDLPALETLAQEPSEIILMVDLPEHLKFLNSIAEKFGTIFDVCLDLDLSMDLPGLRFGVFRSSIQNTDQVNNFLQTLKKCPHIKLVGLMGYEAQIAGVTDSESKLIRTLKKTSILLLQRRREKVVELLLSEGHKLRFVNGGGTGSLNSTTTEKCVTEVTIGSGLYAPHLFDHYHDFKLKPALSFALPIVRHPKDKIYTALGGGYVASGTVTPSKIPTPYLPEGMKLLKHEAAGEVQTPFEYNGKLSLGDLVFFRHAKAGEPCERFNTMKWIRKDKVTDEVKTYRGEGEAFL